YIYGGISQPRIAKIILVVSDTAIKSHCMQFILDLDQKKRLDRIVFDECHKVIYDSNFRPTMLQLCQLVFPVQYLFLTATFPPSILDKFQEVMIIKEPVCIRAVNQKPNVLYNVMKIATGDFNLQVRNLVKKVVDECTGLEKVLVFCR